MNIIREKIGENIHFCAICDERYKTANISVNFVTSLDEDTVSAYALIPSLIDKSNANYPEYDEFSKMLNGMYKADIEAYTSTYGNAHIISVSGSSIDDRFALSGEKLRLQTAKTVYDCIYSPVLSDDGFISDRFETERANLIDDINAQINDKRSYAIGRANEIMFSGQPCGIDKNGTVEDAKALKNSDVLSAYRNLINTAKIEIVFVGADGADEIKDFFTEKFGGENGDRNTEITEVIKGTDGNIKEVTDKFKVAQSKMVLGFKAESFDEAVMNMAIALYGGTPSSKLFKNVREKLSLCYYCAARLNTATCSVRVDCGVENENITKAKDEILRQLELMKNGEITDSEVEETKLALCNSLKSIADSPSTLRGYYLTRILGGDLQSPDERIEKISNVTKEQIIGAVQGLTLDTVYVLTGEGENE